MTLRLMKWGKEVRSVRLESGREGIDVVFIAPVVEVITRIQGPDLMFVQKLQVLKVKRELEKNKFLTWI